jgi:hypothetical protein
MIFGLYLKVDLISSSFKILQGDWCILPVGAGKIRD